MNKDIKVLIIILTVVCILVIFAGIMIGPVNYYTYTEPVVGVVSKVYEKSDGDGWINYDLLCEYEYNGKKYKAIADDTIFADNFVPTKDNPPKELVIYVNPNKPEQISVYRDSIIAPLGMFIAPVVFIVIILLDIREIKKEKNEEK